MWNFNEVITGSDLVINKFKKLGKKVFFATNNSMKTREDFAAKGQKLGFDIDKVFLQK